MFYLLCRVNARVTQAIKIQDEGNERRCLTLGENQIISRWTLFVPAMTDKTASYLIMRTCSSSPSCSALFGVSGVSAGRPIRRAEVPCLFLLVASRALSLLFRPLLLSSSEQHQTKCFSWNVSWRHLLVRSQPSVFIAGFIFPRWSSYFFSLLRRLLPLLPAPAMYFLSKPN